jgi:predicted ATPase
MESLRAALAGARAGEGMVILVEGSPGAGKTSIRSRHQLREAIGGQ